MIYLFKTKEKKIDMKYHLQTTWKSCTGNVLSLTLLLLGLAVFVVPGGVMFSLIIGGTCLYRIPIMVF